MARLPLVTLTTDFGTADHFVGTMKGVMLSINPSIQFVDISHEVASHDIFDGALTLALAYSFFPPGTVHLVVVDPGVGSSRRPLIVAAGRHTFVAPDNGVLSLIFERESSVEARHVTAHHYFLAPVSQTFQGRDVFAPVAAWLTKGVEMEKFGEPVTDFVRFSAPKPRRLEDGAVHGTVIKVDKFGNLLTNIGPGDLPELITQNAASLRIVVNQHEISRLYTSYAQGKPSEVFLILGSSGYLEICQNRAAAAKSLKAGRGTEVKAWAR